MTAWNAFFIEITGTDVGSNGNILVGLLYIPPSQSLVSFYEQLTQLMTKVTREKRNVTSWVISI